MRGRRVSEIEERARELGKTEDELIEEIIDGFLKQGIRETRRAKVLQMRARKGPSNLT